MSGGPGRLRVLLDATAVPADRGGVGRYVDGLLGSLTDGDLDLVVVCQRGDAERCAGLAPAAEVIAAPVAVAHRPARLAWEQTGLPLVAKQVGAHVLHSPHYTLPLRAPGPVVVTLHDATFFSDPQLHTAVKGSFFRSATRVAVRRAAEIVVPSAATRDELARLAGADPAALSVVPHGVDLELFHPPDAREVARLQGRLGLGTASYIAFLGTLEPRKNVPALIRAWITACAGTPDPPALVLAGGAGWDDQVDAAAAQVPPGLRLLRPGYLPLRDLPALLAGAEVVAYPSLGEGFGLPVLEAMACGAAVLTTDRLSLPEVGGDAVAYTQPDEVSVAAALRSLLDEPDRRLALRAAGRRRAEGFTWSRAAEQHVALYARAAAAA